MALLTTLTLNSTVAANSYDSVSVAHQYRSNTKIGRCGGGVVGCGTGVTLWCVVLEWRLWTGCAVLD